MQEATKQPSNDRPLVPAQSFPLFCTTQEISHQIPKEALDTVNDLLCHLANLVEENIHALKINNMKKVFQVWGNVYVSNEGATALQPIESFESLEKAIDAVDEQPVLQENPNRPAYYRWRTQNLVYPRLQIVEAWEK